MSLDRHPRIADWITAEGGRIVLHSGKVDIGQRISDALRQIAHEELTVPLDAIDLAPVRTGRAPDEGMTSGSNSVEQSGRAIRMAAASLRVQAAALASRLHGGAPEHWQPAEGYLNLPGTNLRLFLPDLARQLDPGALVDPDAPLLDPLRSDLPRSGPPRPGMRAIHGMVTGAYSFVHDLERPGMLHARVIRPPHARARLRAIGEAAQERLRADGFEILRDGSFLAIAGKAEWPTIQAAARLAAACDWDHGPGLPQEDVLAQLSADAPDAESLIVADGGTPMGGPLRSPLPEPLPEPDHAARFERPYILHGSLAPSAALAEWTGARLIVHCHSQGIYPLRASIAESLGLEESAVEITHVPGAGCYGHNGADDAAFDAALVAMALPGRPVLLKWSREDEHGWEPFAPAMAVELAARLRNGRITGYGARVYSDTHRGRPRPGPNRAGPGRLLANWFRASPIGPPRASPNRGTHAGMHRNLDPIWDVGPRRLVKTLVHGLPHRTSALRCLGAAANVFAIESFMDELARIAGRGPLEMRLDHQHDPRACAVLRELGRRMAAWPAPAPDQVERESESEGRGLAYAQYKNRMTRVGIAVDLAVDARARIRLRRAIIVADAGRIVDADGLTAQLEGGFLQAASWALHEELRWDRGGILSRDWESYPVLRFDNIPAIEVVLLDRPEEPSVGAGEAAPGPALAAIANAVFDATGLRLRRLPMTPEAIMAAAMRG